MDAETRADLMTFREELASRLASIRNAVASLDISASAGKERDAVNELYRQFHSLKSAANLLGLRPIEQLTHRTEDVLTLARERGVTEPATLSGFLRGVTGRLESLGPHLLRLRAIDISGDLAFVDRFIRECWPAEPS